MSDTIEIQVERTVKVPVGQYCERWGPRRKCDHLLERISSVGWRDGLESPGAICMHTCAVFGEGLRQSRLDSPDESGHLSCVVEKCARCLESRQNKEDS